MALSNAWQDVCVVDLLLMSDGTAGDDISVDERLLRRHGHLEMFWKTPQPDSRVSALSPISGRRQPRECRRRERYELNIVCEDKNERVGSHRVVEGRLSLHDVRARRP